MNPLCRGQNGSEHFLFLVLHNSCVSCTMCSLNQDPACNGSLSTTVLLYCSLPQYADFLGLEN